MRNISMHASRTLLRTSVLALCALPMHGQTANTGAIAGTVSDPSGALVPRAAVVINSQGTGEKRDLATDAEGNFTVQFLTPGNYDLTVRAAGFEPFILKGVEVQITEVSRLKIQLSLSGAKEQIAISTKTPLLQTENATLGRVIDRNTIEELPLVNRNFTEILGLTAGTNTDIVDATQLGAGSQEIRANGARSGDNNFMLNGVDANSYSSNITEVTAAGTLFGPATLYTTGDLAQGATLGDVSRSGSVSSRVNRFFDTKAFAPAPFVPDGGLIDGKYPVSGGGTIFGSLGRNILRGPDQRDFDIAVMKTTPLTEHVKLIFRWEIFNLLNRSNFANPSNDVSTPSTFGAISTLTVNPRIMQYALKLQF